MTNRAEVLRPRQIWSRNLVRQRPVAGWRLWYLDGVDPSAGATLLGPYTLTPFRPRQRARCMRPTPCPAIPGRECHCGWSAFREISDVADLTPSVSLLPALAAQVILTSVVGWGPTTLEDYGEQFPSHWRSQQLEVREAWAGEAVAACVAAFEERYGASLHVVEGITGESTIDRLVAGVSGAAR